MTTTTATASLDTQTLKVESERRNLRWFHERGFTALFILALLVVALAIYEPSFLQWRSLRALLEQSTVLGLIALSQALVIMTGRISLATAALTSLGGVTLALLIPGFGLLGVAIVVVGCTLLNLVIGIAHVTAQIPSFVATLGGMGLFSGLALAVSGADSVFVATGHETIAWLNWRLYGIPFSFLLLLVVSGILMAVFALFPIGRSLRGIGFNERATGLSGVRTGAVVMTVFALSGALCGLAATVQVAQLQSSGATTADSLLLPSIAAVLIGGNAISGGLGGIGRTLIGVLIISVLRVGLDLAGVPSALQPVIFGVLIILTVAATTDRNRGVSVA
ncbi:ABC transporter permease [Gulosibacter sp. 10]|uniref:ABC transporter permease n=1 Tax=Gulosibacter sp. 10 TaxID=1255570 RepID=UPI00097F1272|nr:ABC transporter permease [Gulosibacter sp. 10]SJM70919.1 Ribose ABC transport system, permease protein RbsC (TC 3.A.1.2.1) [Gulosibacter sp. 10]